MAKKQQLDTGETPAAKAARERARERRQPPAARKIGGLSAIRKAFPGEYNKQLRVETEITLLRSDRESKLYTGSKQAFLKEFKMKHGMAYPYKVPSR